MLRRRKNNPLGWGSPCGGEVSDPQKQYAQPNGGLKGGITVATIEGKFCEAKIYSMWVFRKCNKPAKMEYKGKYYCGVHDPVKREEKKKVRNAKWEKEWAESEEKHRRLGLMKQLLDDKTTEELERMVKEKGLDMNGGTTSGGVCGEQHCWLWAGDPNVPLPEGTPCSCGQMLWHTEQCKECGQIVNKAIRAVKEVAGEKG